MFSKIEIVGGFDKEDMRESVTSLVLERGNIYSIVGKTGSGKTQLVEDIESLNNGEGLTKRKILIDGKEPTEELRQGYRSGIISHLSQNMNYIMDMPVLEFLTLRHRLGCKKNEGLIPEMILNTANQLAGERIHPQQLLTKLSGGQSRALMIADVAINSEAPVILIDEVENAGVDKVKAMALLTSKDKIVLLITHDPLLALYGHCRIVLCNGGITTIIQRSEYERDLVQDLATLHEKMEFMREDLRLGKSLRGVDKFVI